MNSIGDIGLISDVSDDGWVGKGFPLGGTNPRLGRGRKPIISRICPTDKSAGRVQWRPVPIYTGGGDRGETGLFGGGRVSKDDLRVEAYGAVDELNAVLGLARTMPLPGEIDALLGRIQDSLFVLGADLATPPDATARADRVVRLDERAGHALEPEIDRLEAGLAPLRTFILPGGSPAGAALHLARTVCRRAERRAVSLARKEGISPGVIVYLNRLSDLLFVMARSANAHAGIPEAPWNPR
jgi:cob(I)alamin adenosyltransferase